MLESSICPNSESVQLQLECTYDETIPGSCAQSELAQQIQKPNRKLPGIMPLALADQKSVSLLHLGIRFKGRRINNCTNPMRL